MAPQNDPSPPPSFPSGRRNSDNGSNNNNSRRGDVSEEAAIYDTFLLVIQNKFLGTPSSPTHEGILRKSKTSSNSNSNINGSSNNTEASSAQKEMDRLDKVYSSSKYNAEKKLLTRISNNGMAEGICFGLGTFIFLRAGPRIMHRFLSRRLQNRSFDSHSNSGSSGNTGGGYHFDIRNAGGSQRMEMPGSVDPPIPRPGLFFRTMKFGLDVFISLTAAFYGSVNFVDSKKLMEEVSDIPLVPGRSLVSDELCDDFIDVYKAIPKKVWNKYDGKSEPLDSISNFVKNCLRRQKVEKEIIQDQQKFGSFGIDGDFHEDGNGHVPIPPPGVSRDIQVEIPWIDKSEDIKVGRDPTVSFEEDEGFQSEYDFGWDNEDTDDNDKEWR